MGKALRDGYRENAFVMTKIDGSKKEAARQGIDSLSICAGSSLRGQAVLRCSRHQG
jgi:hypothetical protein